MDSILTQQLFGIPVPVFHLSPHRFTAFEQQYMPGPRAADVGFHFGTRQTAMNRAMQLYEKGEVEHGDTLWLYEVELNAKRPLRVKENRLGSWSVTSIISTIFDDPDIYDNPPPGITEEMIDARWEDEIWLPDGENLLEMMWSERDSIAGIIAWLNMIGYDSLVYENAYEGGGVSYMVLRPEQIRILSVRPMRVSTTQHSWNEVPVVRVMEI